MMDSKTCEKCEGTGRTTVTVTKEEMCSTCQGLGVMPATWPGKAEIVCNSCNGTGKRITHTTEENVCRDCNGVGEIRS